MSSPSSEPLETLLAAPYGVTERDKRTLLRAALHDAYVHHFRACEAYRRYCERRGLSVDSTFAELEELPFLPVQAFKEQSELLCSVPASEVHVRLHSSATSGVPSAVAIDKETAKLQVRALSAVIAHVLGSKRRPFLVMDLDPRQSSPVALGARAAAVRGFMNLARETEYFMRAASDGKLELCETELIEALRRLRGSSEPVILLGFTFVLYTALSQLHERGERFQLPPGSKVVHIGGWKKLEDRKIPKDRFDHELAELFGIATRDVVDFYGFTEQMGVTYPDGPEGTKVAPAFAEVIVRDPITYRPLPDGEPGLLQFVTPIPRSYPGISILTDDLGVIVARGCEEHGWSGTRFRVLGRAKKAEARGCGDIMADKTSWQGATAAAPSRDVRPRLLFDVTKNHCPATIEEAIDLSKLPLVNDLAGLAARLTRGRERLDRFSVDELIALVAAASRRWLAADSALAPLRNQGLQFLGSFCRSEALRQLADRSLFGARGHLDGFRSTALGERRLLSAQPRGLVAHWLAGNVPLLGMLTLSQAIITRNANLLKAPSSFASLLPLMLEAFRGLEVRLTSGKVLHGDEILESIAVVYFPSDNRAAHEALSIASDVRLSWGGREAVEAIMALPRRFGTEDIVFGPKLSYMAIGREALSSARTAQRLARNAATDASVFDQYACASPHTIFVEAGGGAASARDFAAKLADEMERALVRIPKTPADAGTVGEINRMRMRYELSGELWASKGSEYTVLYDDDWQAGLATPCYSRVITVREIPDILGAARFAHRGIQTVGLALEGQRRLEFARTASLLGAERFPDLGRMTYFDSPWDGLFAMDRLVRWISLGGPT